MINSPPEYRHSCDRSYGTRVPSAEGVDDCGVSSSASGFLRVVRLGEDQK